MVDLIEAGCLVVAGMSDLLSPFVVLFDDDADAFWCFESLLKRVVECRPTPFLMFCSHIRYSILCS